MGMFEMSADYVAEWRQKCREMAESKIGDEEVLAAAGFRQGGASTSYAASKAQLGALVYAGIKLFRKQQAGGLPDKVILAVTPERIRAFKLKARGSKFEIGDEVAVWDRSTATIGTGRGGGMTTLTIESSEGEKTTLVAIGVRDDPVSTETIDVLQGSTSASV